MEVKFKVHQQKRIKLEIIQHKVLRILTGAFKTTPTAELEFEMGERPLDLRRTQMMLNYWLNLKSSNTDHPTLDILSPCWEREKRQRTF